MSSHDDTYLTGKFLVSMPQKDENDSFFKSVIYICSHDKQGAMGFVINKKLKDFSFSDLAVPVPDIRLDSLEHMYLYQGGPVEKVRGFVLHSSEYFKPGTYKVDSDIAVSSSIDVLKDIAYGIGPNENLVALGYCAWDARQLEREILSNRWLVMGADKEILFHTEDELKWDHAMDKTGIDINRFVFETGHA